jgi:hypothetical protein
LARENQSKPSMDWFKGNFAGKKHISWENLWLAKLAIDCWPLAISEGPLIKRFFPDLFYFPLNQSIET